MRNRKSAIFFVKLNLMPGQQRVIGRAGIGSTRTTGFLRSGSSTCHSDIVTSYHVSDYTAGRINAGDSHLRGGTGSIPGTGTRNREFPCFSLLRIVQVLVQKATLDGESASDPVLVDSCNLIPQNGWKAVVFYLTQSLLFKAMSYETIAAPSSPDPYRFRR